MKPMIVEKTLELDRAADTILELRVLSEIQYHTEEEGVRALGTLQVSGQVQDETGPFPLQEEITLDVMAPMEKIQSPDAFKIRLHHYDSRIENRKIVITIHLNVYGMKEERPAIIVDEPENEDLEQERPVPETPMLTQPEVSPVVVVPELPAVPLEVAASETDMSVKDKSPAAEASPEEVDSEEAETEFEDLFDDAENVIVTRRYILAQANDSYTSIAQRYDVNEKQLIALNHNQPLQEDGLVVLPL